MANSLMLCAHYVDRFQSSLGGIVTFVRDLAVACSEHGIEQLLVTNDRGDLADDWSGENGLPAVQETGHVAKGSGRLNGQATDKVLELLAPADVVHLHGMWDLGNIQVARRLHSAGKPYVVSIHGMLDHWSMQQKSLKKKTFLRLFAGKYLRNASRVHATAQGELDQAVEYVPTIRDKTDVVPIPVDLAPFRELPGPEVCLDAFPKIQRDVPRILFLSRLHVKKGLHVLVDAAKLLVDRNVRFQMLIAGPTDSAYAQEIMQQSQRLGLSEHVEFLGMVRGDEKISLFQCCDAFALPTSQENFGIAIAEAMAAGLPIVTTSGTDIWRELQQGGAKIVEATAEAFASALQSIIENPQANHAVAAEGRDFVMQWLDAARVAEGYRQIYKQSLESNRSLASEPL